MAEGILLVGGKGTRLMPLTKNKPKPMLPIAGLPITEHQIVKAKRAGITSLVLATSYLSEVFIPYFGDGSHWGIHLQYAVEDEPLGTGGGIRNAVEMLNGDQSIVVLNGDVLSSHDLAHQINFHEANNADVTLHLTNVADARAFGCVPVDSQGRVEAFLEKMENPVASTINAGCYVFNPRVFDHIPLGKPMSIEREIFPDLILQKRPVFGVVDDSYWIDLGTPAALLQGSTDVVSGRASGAALDEVVITNRTSDFIALEGARVDPGAKVINGSSLGRYSTVQAGAEVDGSIISAGAVVMEDSTVLRSFVAEGAIVKAGMNLVDAYLDQDGIAQALL